MQHEIITGERIVLRPITEADTDRVVAWRNNPNVLNNFIFREKFTPEMHRNWLKTRVATGQVVQYIMEEKSTGLPIGSVYFRDVNTQYHSAEYGIFIGADEARGKGYGSETAALFTRYGFEKLGLHRISLRLLAENMAARKSYENAGFVEEGLFHDMVLLDGKYRDIVFMAKLAPETV